MKSEGGAAGELTALTHRVKPEGGAAAGELTGLYLFLGGGDLGI